MSFRILPLATVVIFVNLPVYGSVINLKLIYREKYAQWKDECRRMFPLIGSGKFITAPIINEQGDPIQDPLVLLETNLGNGGGSVGPGAGSAADGSGNSSSPDTEDAAKEKVPMSKKEIQWKLTLHQIGLYLVNFTNMCYI